MVFYSNKIINEAKALCVNERMGCSRIQRELKKKFKNEKIPSQASISKWMNDKHWRELRDEVKKRQDEKLIEKIVDDNHKENDIIDECLEYIMKNVKSGDVKANLAEVTNLIKLKMAKRGENTDNVGFSTNIPELKKLYNETERRNRLVTIKGD